MFDNTKPNIILFSDFTDIISQSKTLGPYKVAHILRQAGYEVAVIHHLSIFSLSEIRHMLSELISDQTLFVGVQNYYYSSISNISRDPQTDGVALNKIQFGSILPHDKSYNKDIRAFIKKLNPDCKLVLGGPNADDLDYNDIFDYIVIGYSEISILNLAQHLQCPSVELKKSYKSMFGPIIINDSRAEGYNFNTSSMRYEDHDAILPNEALMLEVGRGCIFKCAFCSYPMNGKLKLDFIRSKEMLKKELLDNYQRFGTTRYVIVDDTFNDSVEKCKMFYEMSQELPFQLEYWAYIRLDLIVAHPETMEHLFGSGLRAAFFGMETLDHQAGARIGKGGNKERLIETANTIKYTYGNKITLHASFIFGLPGESLDSIEATKNFILSDSCPFDSFTLNPLVIRPTNRKYSNEFLSDIDKNFAKYGYKNLGTKKTNSLHYETLAHEQGQMIWQNEHTDFFEMKQLADDVRAQLGSKKKVSGSYSFHLSGPNIDLYDTLGAISNQIDWHLLDQKKMIRANEYKKLIFEKCNISPFKNSQETEASTFSEWVKLGNPLL